MVYFILFFYSEIPIVLRRKILGVAEENECLGECTLGEVCSRQCLATIHVRSFTTANISKIIEIPQNPTLERPCVRIRVDRHAYYVHFFFIYTQSNSRFSYIQVVIGFIQSDIVCRLVLFLTKYI